MVGFEKALGAVKVIKDQIQYRYQSLLNLARGYFIGSAFDLQTPPALTVAPNCSHVPYYLVVDQIAAGLFIDFTLLLPENLGKLSKSVPTQAHLFRKLRSELKPLNDFRDWTQAWAVLAKRLLKCFQLYCLFFALYKNC